MNLLFKLTKQKDRIGGYHIHGRSGRVVFGVPNKVRGNRSKWFWVVGAWKMVSRDQPTVELGIPTIFREKNPSPRILVAADLSLDSKVVGERIKRLPNSDRDARLLHTEKYRLAIDTLSFFTTVGSTQKRFMTSRRI
ncbi:hypothetical protein OROMI_025088 [Orobanche minor]